MYTKFSFASHRLVTNLKYIQGFQDFKTFGGFVKSKSLIFLIILNIYLNFNNPNLHPLAQILSSKITIQMHLYEAGPQALGPSLTVSYVTLSLFLDL